MKLTSGEVGYILEQKKGKFDWIFEGTLEETDDGYGYHLTIYLIKPIYYVLRFLLTPFAFIYFVFEDGVKDAKKELDRQLGRDIAHLYFHKYESTSERYRRANFIAWIKKSAD